MRIASNWETTTVMSWYLDGEGVATAGSNGQRWRLQHASLHYRLNGSITRWSPSSAALERRNGGSVVGEEKGWRLFINLGLGFSWRNKVTGL